MCRGECFYFDYGAVAFWNLSERQEREVIRTLLGPCLVDSLTQNEIEVDEFQVRAQGPRLRQCVAGGWRGPCEECAAACVVPSAAPPTPPCAAARRSSTTASARSRTSRTTPSQVSRACRACPCIPQPPASPPCRPRACLLRHARSRPPLNHSHPSLLQTHAHIVPCPAVNYRLRNDHLIKLSISHALAQSAKLSVYEERVIEIVENTKDLPETLAATGEVRGLGGGGAPACTVGCWFDAHSTASLPAAGGFQSAAVRPCCRSPARHAAAPVPVPLQVGLSRKQIAQFIGRVFIQKSAVNLLSTVLDTPGGEEAGAGLAPWTCCPCLPWLCSLVPLQPFS